MKSYSNRTALITGATSGLGFEAAAQLAEQGYRKVIVTGRTDKKAHAAIVQLVKRTGRDVFESLAIDFGVPSSVRTAVNSLTTDSTSIDVLLLNAGLVSGTEQSITDEQVEITFAATLIGHHQLTAQLLANKLLADTAHIVIAGSEAARGDVPMMNVVDLPGLAEEHFNRDLDLAAESLIRGTSPGKYKPNDTYANAKLFVAWWSASLSRRLPAGMTVNAVSPGAAPNTNAGRNAGFFIRRVMMPVMRVSPAWMKLAAPTSVAASRYVEAADFDQNITGNFFASAPKKMTGPLHRVELPHVLDFESQEAAWNAIVTVAGSVAVPAA